MLDLHRRRLALQLASLALALVAGCGQSPPGPRSAAVETGTGIIIDGDGDLALLVRDAVDEIDKAVALSEKTNIVDIYNLPSDCRGYGREDCAKQRLLTESQRLLMGRVIQDLLRELPKIWKSIRIFITPEPLYAHDDTGALGLVDARKHPTDALVVEISKDFVRTAKPKQLARILFHEFVHLVERYPWLGGHLGDHEARPPFTGRSQGKQLVDAVVRAVLAVGYATKPEPDCELEVHDRTVVFLVELDGTGRPATTEIGFSLRFDTTRSELLDLSPTNGSATFDPLTKQGRTNLMTNGGGEVLARIADLESGVSGECYDTVRFLDSRPSFRRIYKFAMTFGLHNLVMELFQNLPNPPAGWTAKGSLRLLTRETNRCKVRVHRARYSLTDEGETKEGWRLNTGSPGAELLGWACATQEPDTVGLYELRHPNTGVVHLTTSQSEIETFTNEGFQTINHIGFVYPP